VSDLGPEIMYAAVARNEVDVICAFATDGRIAAYQLRTLADDRRFFPPYHAAPVVRQALLDAHPELGPILDQLAGLIDEPTMQRLNLEVDESQREPADVAREFLALPADRQAADGLNVHSNLQDAAPSMTEAD
jgi:glycine betaine/choline ABC-type transport system substrate-binding protein